MINTLSEICIGGGRLIWGEAFALGPDESPVRSQVNLCVVDSHRQLKLCPGSNSSGTATPNLRLVSFHCIN